MIDLNKLIEEKGLQTKFAGCAPEEFVLVHEKTLEFLKEFDNWKKWKNDEISIQQINKLHFENS